MTQNLYIVRGLPGSGKSTYARKLAKQNLISYYEADDYFTDNHGNYNFDPKGLGAAHAQCKKNVFNELEEGRSVIVSNTFTTVSELKDYVDYAKMMGVKITIVQCTSNFGSVHNVPAASIEKMKARWVDNDKLPFACGVNYLEYSGV